MNKSTAKKRIQELTVDLNTHNHKYYVLSEPIISDFEFDKLLEELILLETQYPDLLSPESPSQRVGGTITKEFRTIKHKYPMLSLGNTYSDDELFDFDNRIKKMIGDDFEYVCELKLDGVAISITYQDGKLVQAVTRGDGEKGDDVTSNIKTIRSIPLQLTGNDYPNLFEVRGEILMPKAVFNELNKQTMESLTEDGYGEEEIENRLMKNPRNAASGTIKMQDSAVVASRHLDCLFYFIYGEELGFNNHYDSIKKLKSWGFKISDYTAKVNDITGVLNYINEWQDERFQLPYETDGVVVKINNYRNQSELGFTAKSPRWAISYKFKPESGCTKLNSITYQVGRTGAVTPVANLNPILLAGTTVRRATLHNADFISKLDLHEDDYVFIEKGGDIIPKITGVELTKRTKKSVAYKFISKCPECNTILKREEGGAHFYCPNEENCPPQIKGKIEHFIARKAMDIDSIGEGTIELLYSNELIHDAADLYELKYEDLLGLEKVISDPDSGKSKKLSLKEKSVENILEGISKSKSASFSRVLYAMGIRYVGETVAKKLANHFGSIENLQQATLEELINAPEVGEKIAKSIIKWFSKKKNIDFISKIRAAGLILKSDKSRSRLSENLDGISFVVSGVFVNFSRDELKALIERHGGRVVSGISKKTNYLVAGEDSGPSKLKKAENLEVNIITEEQFLNMIND